jgi:hypothetical protein
MNPPPTLLTGMEDISDGAVVSNDGEAATIDVNGAIIEVLADYAIFEAIKSMSSNGIDSLIELVLYFCLLAA